MNFAIYGQPEVDFVDFAFQADLALLPESTVRRKQKKRKGRQRVGEETETDDRDGEREGGR